MTTPTSNSQLREAIAKAMQAHEEYYDTTKAIWDVRGLTDRILTAISPLVEEMQKQNDDRSHKRALELACSVLDEPDPNNLDNYQAVYVLADKLYKAMNAARASSKGTA